MLVFRREVVLRKAGKGELPVVKAGLKLIGFI
jgi:hypothetical protein